jgi:hypothetical protein
MKLDINLAWRQASAAVAANREVLLALAGVFILLPRLAFELFAPAPSAQAGVPSDQASTLQFDQTVQLLQTYYAHVMPWLLAVALVETAGTLAVLCLFTDRSHPTVGQAIRRGVGGVLPYLAAQMLFALGIMLIGGLVLGLAGMSGIKPLMALAFAALIVGVVYAGARLMVLAPVIIVEHVRTPVAALARAWVLTRGNAGRILGLLMLFLVVMVVAMMAVSGVVGSLGVMLAGQSAGRIVVAVVTSVLSTTFAVYMVAVIAAIHRQLAGPSSTDLSATFS